MKIKMGWSLAVLPMVLAGCVMPPDGVNDDDLIAFDEAVASIGCVLETEAHYLPVELQTGLPREQVIAIAQFRVAQEQALPLQSGGIKLITGACTPPEEETQVAAAAG
ncbi:MAG: hypothetical protein QNJ09_08315 [Paracoccaceae bacterium]|nr:hypothetical protein [Paracoccaceae bacterium]